MPKKAAKENVAVTTQKTTTPARARKAAPPKKNGSTAEPTPEEIALRAYFISERRLREGTAGNERDDWAEAERQLKSERKASKPRRKKSE